MAPVPVPPSQRAFTPPLVGGQPRAPLAQIPQVRAASVSGAADRRALGLMVAGQASARGGPSSVAPASQAAVPSPVSRPQPSVCGAVCAAMAVIF